MARMIRSAILILLAAVAPNPRAQAQCVARPGIPQIESFSSLATVGGLDHPSGIKLVLRENGNRVRATLRDYVGESEPEEIKLVATIEEKKSDGSFACELELKGTAKLGPVTIHGVITVTNFQGTIERHVRGKTFSRISLRRSPSRDADGTREG